MLAPEDLFYEPEKESRTRSIARRTKAIAHGKFAEEQAPEKGETQAQEKNRLLSAKRRNYLLVIAFLMLLGDCIISLTFALMSPSDERTRADYVSRKQLRTVYLQGFVALIDGLISTGVVIMVVHGVMRASLDVFLVAAAVKTSQATFFSLMQFGYPTVLRLSIVGFLLILRLASTWLIVRVAWISGILTTRPSKELPKVVRSLLEAGAIETGTMKNMDRPLSVGLVERLLGWLLPVKERTAAVGLGRVQVTVIAFFLLLMSPNPYSNPNPNPNPNQVTVIAFFLLLMSAYMAFSDYWSVLGEQVPQPLALALTRTLLVGVRRAGRVLRGGAEGADRARRLRLPARHARALGDRGEEDAAEGPDGRRRPPDPNPNRNPNPNPNPNPIPNPSSYSYKAPATASSWCCSLACGTTRCSPLTLTLNPSPSPKP